MLFSLRNGREYNLQSVIKQATTKNKQEQNFFPIFLLRSFFLFYFFAQYQKQLFFLQIENILKHHHTIPKSFFSFNFLEQKNKLNSLQLSRNKQLNCSSGQQNPLNALQVGWNLLELLFFSLIIARYIVKEVNLIAFL